jgi:hypothetical protein
MQLLRTKTYIPSYIKDSVLRRCTQLSHTNYYYNFFMQIFFAPINTSVVCIVATLWTSRSGGRIPAGATFSSPNCPKRLCGPHSVLFNEYRPPFPEAKRPRREVNRSPASSAEAKNDWSYTSAPPPPQMRLHGVDRDFSSLGAFA